MAPDLYRLSHTCVVGHRRRRPRHDRSRQTRGHHRYRLSVRSAAPPQQAQCPMLSPLATPQPGNYAQCPHPANRPGVIPVSRSREQRYRPRWAPSTRPPESSQSTVTAAENQPIGHTFRNKPPSHNDNQLENPNNR